MKSATDLVTLYLANNLTADNCSFTEKCVKRPVTKQQYSGTMFYFMLIFQATAKESWEDFLRGSKQKETAMQLLHFCLMFVVS